MSSDQKTIGIPGGLCTILFLIFLTLKLAGIGQVADWSWWWVTSPIWIPLLITLGFCLVFGMFYIVIILIIAIAESIKFEE